VLEKILAQVVIIALTGFVCLVNEVKVSTVSIPVPSGWAMQLPLVMVTLTLQVDEGLTLDSAVKSLVWCIHREMAKLPTITSSVVGCDRSKLCDNGSK